LKITLKKTNQEVEVVDAVDKVQVVLGSLKPPSDGWTKDCTMASINVLTIEDVK